MSRRFTKQKDEVHLFQEDPELSDYISEFNKITTFIKNFEERYDEDETTQNSLNYALNILNSFGNRITVGLYKIGSNKGGKSLKLKMKNNKTRRYKKTHKLTKEDMML